MLENLNLYNEPVAVLYEKDAHRSTSDDSGRCSDDSLILR